ncbi:MAG: putative lipid II flippase FtsW [Candidatus Omnitrophota bacterium]
MERINLERQFVFISVVALSLFGLLLIYSASCIYALRTYNNSAYFFSRQVVYLVISLVAFFLALLLDIGTIRRFNKEFLFFTVFLLVLVLVIGKKAGGARRWLSLGVVSFQPSEILKIAFPLYVADFFVRKGGTIRLLREGLLPLLFIWGVFSVLIVLEPDLGTVVFWLIWIFFMLFIARAKARHLGAILLVGLLFSFILVKTHPYRFARLVSYLDPWQDPRGSGFQIIQSQIAFGEGGLWGTGLGSGRQKLLFLPAAHTDFVFSIIAEEFGFFGSLAVLSVYFLIVIKALEISMRLKDNFARYVCLGISFLFGLEVIINVGVSCGLMPTKGMALPFISYGGTNLFVHYVLLGIFFNLTRQPRRLAKIE